MVVVGGTVLIKAECVSDAHKLCLWMTEETLKEVGCITYGFHQSLNDPNTIQVFEEWDSIEDLTNHLATSHFAEFIEKLTPLAAGEPNVKIYEIESVRPL